MRTWSHSIKNWDHLARIANYRAQKLAGICGVSLRQLQRHFHDVFGIELRNWLNELRLQDGAHLLGTRSVKEVAFLLGFKRSNHFSREFKKLFRVTPEEFLLQNPERNPQIEIEILRLRDSEETPPS